MPILNCAKVVWNAAGDGFICYCKEQSLPLRDIDHCIIRPAFMPFIIKRRVLSMTLKLPLTGTAVRRLHISIGYCLQASNSESEICLAIILCKFYSQLTIIHNIIPDFHTIIALPHLNFVDLYSVEIIFNR